ncbi:hypothetical protein, partial [Aureimonas fodinaquatilis]|uniref:hypothetical protein n=1 Tax=Aureimonas fodinaquatilis TaxID=2565783 RepID=UPI001AEEC76F
STSSGLVPQAAPRHNHLKRQPRPRHRQMRAAILRWLPAEPLAKHTTKPPGRKTLGWKNQRHVLSKLGGNSVIHDDAQRAKAIPSGTPKPDDQTHSPAQMTASAVQLPDWL